MNLILQNLTIATRNLMKYKLQAIISVLSIAIGIVTLALVHSVMQSFRLPSIINEPHYDRTYYVNVEPLDPEHRELVAPDGSFSFEQVRVLRANGGLPSADGDIILENGLSLGTKGTYNLGDTLFRKCQSNSMIIDAPYPNHVGMRSAITGEKIKPLREGEAIIGEQLAQEVFGDVNPIGATYDVNFNESVIKLTIVDVYKNPGQTGNLADNYALLFCVGDRMQEFYKNSHIYCINVVLKEGRTMAQLEGEINSRLKPFGAKCRIRLESEVLGDQITAIKLAHVIVYAIGSLILIAALIGFLRMQTQLFWMRRRELALRIVNGAKRMQLFWMLLTEVVIVAIISILLAVILALLLRDFITTQWQGFVHDGGFDFGNMHWYCLAVGGMMIAASAVIVWITLQRICNTNNALAATMRNSRTHIFRNIMLCLQITVSILFVCSTIEVSQWTKGMLVHFNIPENDADYSEVINLRTHMADNPHRLTEEILRNKNIDLVMKRDYVFFNIPEIEASPMAETEFGDNRYFRSIFNEDTTFINYFNMDVKWFGRNIDHNNCVLVQEEFYQALDRIGVTQGGVLTFCDRQLPIAGTFKSIAYDYNYNKKFTFVISKDLFTEGKASADIFLVPKKGKYNELMNDINQTISKLEPAVVDKMVYNMREKEGEGARVYTSFAKGIWILGFISIIICTMSVYSTIALDTRSRRKEVAIRKINGAKRKDIIRLFARMYVVLCIIGIIIAIPCVILLHAGINVEDAYFGEAYSVIPSIFFGIVIVPLTVALIVGWHINKTMKINPSEIISKE